MFKKLFFLKGQLRIIKRINDTLINLVESSTVNKNDSFIRLSNGKMFTGQKAKNYQKILYFFLKRQLRKKAHISLMQVLFDIDFRYMSRNNNNLNECKYLELEKGDMVFEVGAYIGYHAIRMSEIVGNSGKIIAIEAIKENYDIMVRNIELNKITNIIPLNIGIWNKKGVVVMNTDQDQKNSIKRDVINAKNRIEIKCNTIDNIASELNLKKIDFIRIQINGAEIEALEGMLKIIKYMPKILIASPYRNKKIVQRFLNSKGYIANITDTGIFAEKPELRK